MGCDPHLQGARPGNHSFQSTHPVWGATADVLDIADKISISIHAPRMGCDEVIHNLAVGRILFQSTHPVWGATCLVEDFVNFE